MGLDWDTQPDPFLRYRGAPLLALDHVSLTDEPLYEEAFVEGNVSPRPLDHKSVSQLFGDSLALSAWKQAGSSSWSLRVNPSSGNLHPTEAYLLCGPVDGLCVEPMVAHYAPKGHALERRCGFAPEHWQGLTDGFPEPTIFVGLTSIHWREAWKYGERAYRYCQHDLGHAIGAVNIAAAALGWQATLMDELGTDAVATLLGVAGAQGPEAETADCLLAIHPQGLRPPPRLPCDVLETFAGLSWVGKANELSSDHVAWPIIDRAAAAAVKPATTSDLQHHRPAGEPLAVGSEAISLRKVIFGRRSAVALNGRTGLASDGFYQLLRKACAGPAQFPFNALPWRPKIDLALYVHRVADLSPGLYFLVRDASRLQRLREATSDDFAWEVPDGCPEGLGLYRLEIGDARRLSAQVSCHQEIAADGCFSLGMIADFEGPIRQNGPWMYPRLFWECGVIGQVLYLEAEALGIRGTGIGCFFDDPVHGALGLSDREFQSLYHFTMGGPVEDLRLRTLPPYGAGSP